MWDIIKSAWRYAMADRLFTAITGVSLALGCAAAILAGVYVNHELSYDDWLPASDRILRLETNVATPGRSPQSLARTMSAMRPTMQERFPDEIEASTRIRFQWNSFQRGDELYNQYIGYADPNILQVLEFDVVEGDADNPLARPDSIMISERFRDQVFGDRPVVGETLELEGQAVTVTAVTRDLPEATHLSTDVYMSLETPLQRFPPADFDAVWDSPNVNFYVRAPSRAAFERLLDEMPGHADAVMAPRLENSEQTVTFEATPIRSIHLRPSRDSQEISANITQLYVFAAAAGAVLVVSTFNFVLLSMARAFRRTREVGMRKAVGGDRGQLFRHFFGEAAVLAGLAVVVGYALAELALPTFATALEAPLQHADLRHPRLIVVILAVAAIVMFAAAAYPALYLARQSPARTLGGQSVAAGGSPRLIDALVGLQFAVALTLIVFGGVVAAQSRFVAEKDLGFDKANRMVVLGITRAPHTTAQRVETIKNRLSASPAILSVTSSVALPSWDWSVTSALRVEGDTSEGMQATPLQVDLDYFETYGVEPLAGRLFDAQFGADRTYIEDAYTSPDELPAIVSLSALPGLNAATPQDALDRSFELPLDQGGAQSYRVVGVVPDMHFRTLREAITPLVFIPDPARVNVLTVHFDADQREAAATALEEAWNAAYPDQSLAMSYLDSDLLDQYQDDQRLTRVVLTFAGLAIGVAMMGLYGLVSFFAERRRKEIGVRRALGASKVEVAREIVVRFGAPLIVANLIAWPIAYWLATRWLSDFVYRVDMNPAWLLVASAAALALAVIAIGAKAWASASRPPTQALRYE